MNIACHIRNDTVYEHLQAALARVGFTTERFSSETLLMRAMRRKDFDFIVVDVGSELNSGESVCSWLTCRTGDSTPVLVISPVRNAELAADTLNSGADDFVIRPFDAVELIARMRAVLRRCDKRQVRRLIELSGFVLDRESNRFSYEGK